MKKYLFIPIIFFQLGIFAQKTEVFKIDSLPKQGIVLDKDWKFKVGDNSEFSKMDFDDADWKSINPALDIFDLPQIPKTGEIIWFRLHLSFDSSLSRQLVMMLLQSGASEIFLNGKLIHHFGILSNKPIEIKAFNPALAVLSFPVQKSLSQVLAVRYALQPNILYTKIFGNSVSGLFIEINSTENGIEELSRISDYNIFSAGALLGIYVVLCILFFTFYLFFPAKKTNLYFSIYALLVTTFDLLQIYIYSQHFIESLYWLYNFLAVVGVIAELSLLLAVYKLFDQKTKISFWCIVVLGAVSIPMAAFVYGWGWLVLGIGLNLCTSGDILRVALHAIGRKKKEAWIIATGSFIFFVFRFMFWYSLINVALIGYAYYFFMVADLGIPLSVAIFLGYDFAKTARNLQYKLAEVETLSAEKQHILTNQNDMLEKQVKERTNALNQSLDNLKSTQAQLIQSEKMASLGELTAGIAHEIQNPLNFVNNFSELNKELLEEMKEEVLKGNLDEVKKITNDVIDNEQKINHHGKRADAIVKGMLQHSRSSGGVKEPTNINDLADEYLRLAYHGLRAKDNSFNATLKTDFDGTIEKIDVIPQDFGRVLLNLYNNAFYAVTEKKKQAGDNYEPIVSVHTKKINGKAEIRIKDNGNGIPGKAVDKIFQPFFTTKPTGQGTGLGLSLSYDIIKAHGGEIKVETKEGEGCEFMVQLPAV